MLPGRPSGARMPGGRVHGKQNRRYAVAILCAAAIAVVLASGCASAPAEKAYVSPYVSPYERENLREVEGRYCYFEGEDVVSKTGIDVSTYQGDIDWSLVAADGVDFAFIRLGSRGATEGDLYLDERYHANIAAAQAAGLECGVYFFSQAIDEAEAVEEADFVIGHLQGRSLEYPVVYDCEPVSGLEGRVNKLSGDQLTRNALAFCTRVEEAGYTAMLYGNKQDIAKLDLDVLAAYGIWFAEYDAAFPSGQFDFSLWQYSNNGTVAGIDTRVDLNLHFPAVG